MSGVPAEVALGMVLAFVALMLAMSGTSRKLVLVRARVAVRRR